LPSSIDEVSVRARELQQSHRRERCRCPFKQPSLTVAAAAGSAAAALQRRHYNQRLSACRQRVEHAFSRMKKTFRQLQTVWQFPLHRLPAAFRAAALLCNWLQRERNLYMVDEI
jgi:histidinol-phosphate/aromatic aminotransferase/cobyric acid decarboxylase-like protein